MVFKPLLMAGAVFSLASGQDVALKKDSKNLGANSSVSDTTSLPQSKQKILTLFKSEPSYHATPKVAGARVLKSQTSPRLAGSQVSVSVAAPGPASITKNEDLHSHRKAVEISELQKKGTDVFSLLQLLEIAAFLAVILIPVMLTQMGREVLIAAGILSADSEISKLSMKASGGLARWTHLPLVQEAAGAIGFGHQRTTCKKSDVEMNPLINESDGDSEDEAELTVDLSKLFQPMNKAVDCKSSCNETVIKKEPESIVSDATMTVVTVAKDVRTDTQVQDVVIDFGCPEYEIQDGDYPMQFDADDFFDEDDDF